MNPVVPPATPAQPGQGLRQSGDTMTRTMKFDVSLTTLIKLVLVIASLWLLIRLAPILLVLVVALLIVGTMSPAVSWLEARGFTRSLAIASVFGMVTLVCILIVTVTIPSILAQAAALLEREPGFRAGLADRMAQFHVTAPFAEWLRTIRYNAPGSNLGAEAFAYSLRVFKVAAYGMSAIFLALYIMIDRDRLRGGLFALIPRSQHMLLSRIMMNLETIVGAYIRGQLITCFLIGAFTFILLRACGVENAMALAVFAAVADVLPYVGAFLSIGPAVIAALGHSSTAAIIVLLAMLAYEEFESRVLVPRIYGRALRLPSSVVLFALLAGGTLLGLIGALLALPFAAMIMMLIEELRLELPGEQEQDSDSAVRERDDLAEEEYERRSEGVGAQEAAAIAVEISADRKQEEIHPVILEIPEAEQAER
jgi:predicted PurR-regulated permease PerM